MLKKVRNHKYSELLTPRNIKCLRGIYVWAQHSSFVEAAVASHPIAIGSCTIVLFASFQSASFKIFTLRGKEF